MKLSKIDLVVTRHGALLQYLMEKGMANTETKVLTHATAKDVQGRIVAGVLPLHLAAEADRVIEIPLDVPLELRGKELSLDQVRLYARTPVEYSVCRVRDVSMSDLDAMETSRMIHRIREFRYNAAHPPIC